MHNFLNYYFKGISIKKLHSVLKVNKVTVKPHPLPDISQYNYSTSAMRPIVYRNIFM